MMKKVFLFFIFIFSLLFFSCGKLNLLKDFSESQSLNENVHIVTGKSEKQSFENSNKIIKESRNATPTYTESNLFYYFYATADNQDTQKSASSENSFKFTLQNATWTIYCEIYYGENLTESNYSTGSKIFVGNTTLTLSDESPTNEEITIQTSPYTESDSSGSANLLIYTETTSVKSAIASWKNISTNATGSQVLDLTKTDSGGNYCDAFTFNGNSVQAGVYKVTFKFYSGAVSSGNVTGTLICSTVKIINIANSLSTEEWTTNGGFIQNNKFSVTTSNILISKAVAIYVDSTASENGSGISVSSPLNSFEDAISLVEGFGINARICIKSGTTATISSSISSSQNFIITTYTEDGTIYDDSDTILSESERGTLQRTSDEYIDNSSGKFTCTNINIEDGVSSPTNALFMCNVDFSNCSVTAKLALIVYSSSTVALSNVSFTGDSGATVSVYGGTATITDCTFTSGGYALYVTNGGTATVKKTTFNQNVIGICIFDSTSSTTSNVTLDGVTINNSTSYGIQTYQNFTLSGSCTFDDIFYLQDEAMINFDSTYADASNTNSVYIEIDSSRYVRGNQVITGSNIETASSNFAMEKEGWSINSEGKIYEINVGTATNQYYYVDPTNGDDATAEGGNYDKAYKTLQGAVDAINTANAATSGKEYTIYLLGDLQIDSSTTFTTTSDVSDSETVETPTLCDIENISSNALTLNVTSWATDSSSYVAISGDGSTIGRLFKVNGSTSAVNLSVDNVNIKNLFLKDSVNTNYRGAVLFMCGTNDTASFGSGVVITNCLSYIALFYPTVGLLTLNCTAKDNTSAGNGTIVRLNQGTGILNVTGGTYTGSNRESFGLYTSSAFSITSGTIDSISATRKANYISGDVYIAQWVLRDSGSSFTIGDTYSTTNVSKIVYEKYSSLSGGETVFSIADSSSLTVADVIDKFALYDSTSATEASSTYSLEADSTGKKALLKIKANSAGGSTTNPLDNTVTFSSTACDSLAYGSSNAITITAAATSGSAITWGDVSITTSGGTAISDSTYVSTTKTNGTATTDGTSSTATCVVTFTSSMPPGTYYINVNAEVDGVTYSGTVTATVVK